MRNSNRMYFILVILLSFLIPGLVQAQDIAVNIGYKDSIQSAILNETRTILIHLPNDYNTSDKIYPVLYRLDGDTDLLLETISTVNRISLGDEIAPEMIIVAIENTKRFKDMWPTNTKYNPEPDIAGASDFLGFIEKELIPHIEQNYRTYHEKILCGQSLSAIFTIYAFLTRPTLFNSYIASSGAFPDCENYFKELSEESFQQMDQFNGQKLFITNGMHDPLDPDGEIRKQIDNFSLTIKEKLGNKISYKYVIYENEGHVPFHSLYDGLKFIYETNAE